jgi:AAA+ superfamily predicted ATPase
MTAAVLAGEASLPLLTIQARALITKYMGETAAKLQAQPKCRQERHSAERAGDAA